MATEVIQQLTRQELLKQVRQLPVAEQHRFVAELVHDARADPELTDAWKAEVDRWIADDDADVSPAIDWSVLREQVLRGEI